MPAKAGGISLRYCVVQEDAVELVGRFLLAKTNKFWYASCTRKLEVASIFGVTGGAVCP